jgi:hypothetical protein
MIEEYVERVSAGATKGVENAEAAVLQQQEDMRKAWNFGLTSREPTKTFQLMTIAMGDSLTDLTSCDGAEDNEDKDHAGTEVGQLT